MLRWLISVAFTGISLHASIFLIDVLINVSLCLPAAYAICRLSPGKLLVYLPLAVIPGFIWQYRLFFEDSTLFRDWAIFVPGVMLALFSLPLAVLRCSDNSFRKNYD